MGAKFHAMTSDSEVPYDREGTAQFFAVLIQSEDGCVLIGDGGLLAGVATTYPHLDKSFRTANEIYWWTEGKGNALLKAFEDWAKSKGITKVINSHRHDARNGALQRLYRILGFEPHEHYYIKAI